MNGSVFLGVNVNYEQKEIDVSDSFAGLHSLSLS